MPEGGDLCESMRVIRSLAPPSGALQRRPLQPRLLWLAGVFPGGSFSSPPPDYSDDARRITRPRRLGAASARVGGKPPFPHSAAPGDRAPTWSAHELLQFGPNQAGARAYNCPLAPDNLGGARSPTGERLSLPLLREGEGPRECRWGPPVPRLPPVGRGRPNAGGGPPSSSFPCSRPPPPRLLGGGGRGRGVPC